MHNYKMEAEEPCIDSLTDELKQSRLAVDYFKFDFTRYRI